MITDSLGVEIELPHADILSNVTGSTQKEIWDALIYFLLYGKPSHTSTRHYCIYFCWKAIQLSIGYGEKVIAGDIKSHQWPMSETLAATVLDWETATVMTQYQNYTSGERTINSQLAFQVVSTISEFRAWHQDHVQQILTGLPTNYIQPGMWVWYVEKDRPAWVLEITAQPPYDAPVAISPTRYYRILVPKGNQPTGSPVNPTVRALYFDIETVQLKQLARIQPDFDSLQY